MLELRPVDVFVGVSPKVKILLPDWWIKFSNGFPDSLNHVKNKTMHIVKNTQVTYELSWIVKEACYMDVNLSNEDTAEKLCPDDPNNLYEMILALRPGNYYIIPYFPAETPIYRLDYSTMTPLPSSSALKYLGIIRPEDSPIENPTFKLYLVYKLKPVILRVVADDGVDYEKITIDFLINRCLMEEKPLPANVVPKNIFYLDELKW